MISRVSRHRVPRRNSPVLSTSTFLMPDTRPAFCSMSVKAANTWSTGASSLLVTVTVVITRLARASGPESFNARAMIRTRHTRTV